jgi:hypothetical protein
MERLKEKSTWLSIFTVASLFGMQIEPELKDPLIEAILAVAAVVAFIFRETIYESRNLRGNPHQHRVCDPDVCDCRSGGCDCAHSDSADLTGVRDDS